jgi:CRISPR-associated endonuclease/helicase Cas3
MFMGKKDDRKFENLNKLIYLLLENPKGLTKAEISRKLGVHRSTAGEYIDSLEGINAPVFEISPNRFTINRDDYEVKLSVNIHESLAFHLATRLLTTRTDKYNPHAASALRKLGQAIEKLAPRVSEHMARSANVLDGSARRRDPIFLQALQTLTQAWAQGVKVRLTHELEGGEIHEYVFAPYFIEPYAVGHTVHVIGRREPINKIRTFKVERIRTIQLLVDQAYTIPESFDPTDHLKDAWGIWFTDHEPELVRLKFSQKVAKRVTETDWHSDQKTTTQDDGYLLWEARVANWQEMLPWIRGWGADVEVLEPSDLRKELKNNARLLGKEYGLEKETYRPPFQLPYAKTNPDDKDEIHLLIYHLIDVGQVALSMWQEILTEDICQHLSRMLNLSFDECGRLLAFLAALHDLGKAGPAYQSKYAPKWLKIELAKAGLALGKASDGKAFNPKTPHGHITTWALETLLPEKLGLDNRFAKKIAAALGGHHGTWPSPNATNHIQDNDEWDTVRNDLFWHLQAVFSPPKEVVMPSNTININTFLTILSGLTSVADWIGSRNKEQFGFEQEVMSTRLYAKQSVEKARAELNKLGWIGWQPDGEIKTFAETFAYLNFEKARSVQREVIEAAKDIQKPTLLILEAPTGLGKTEVALYLADLWLQKNKGRGLYVAMPTQATSNQMFDRTKEYLEARYPMERLNLHLVHGQAGWSDTMQEIKLESIGDDPGDGVAAMTWFTPRKRTLLAPFGVGTVDQTLMSILQTKHFFVRLFGLAHKVVIFDEVHAYDTYMNTLFHRLLEWLHAIGTSVIILSATLPAKTRRELVKAYTIKDLNESESTYPALTIANADRQETLSLPKPDDYTLQLDWSLDRDPASLVDFLHGELKNGGCAAIICNTVRRSQDIYRTLSDANLVPKNDLILFHSRFPPVWRKGIEEKVLKKFGKNGGRPHQAIVVATQVIEQSLDIDFDLMITDLAPLDLILQRAGRLHRHKGNERYGLPRRLMITEPEKNAEGLPDFGIDKWIYSQYILLRSYLSLHGRKQIAIPKDTLELIEAVYDENADLSFPNEEWQKANQKNLEILMNEEREKEINAGKYLVLAPQKRRYLQPPIYELEEDNPEVHKAFQARTRDIDLSLTVICFYQIEGKLGVYNDDGEWTRVDLDKSSSTVQAKVLLKNALSLQHKGVITPLLTQKVPPKWQEMASLRYCRYFIFKDGLCEDIKNYTLSLNQEIGLTIIKQEDV